MTCDDNCRHILRELHVYLDRECGESVTVAIHHHLAECRPCLERADFELAVRTLVASRCREAAPAQLVDRIIGVLREE